MIDTDKTVAYFIAEKEIVETIVVPADYDDDEEDDEES